MGRISRVKQNHVGVSGNIGGDSSQLQRHQRVGEHNILYSSRDPLTKIVSHPFEVPIGQWALVHWVNFAHDEAYTVELVFDAGWCCNEPGGCAPYLVACGCQPKLSVCDGPNPLLITHPGKFQLRRISADRGLSTITYSLIPSNSVPHELSVGWCDTTNSGGCETC